MSAVCQKRKFLSPVMTGTVLEDAKSQPARLITDSNWAGYLNYEIKFYLTILFLLKCYVLFINGSNSFKIGEVLDFR